MMIGVNAELAQSASTAEATSTAVSLVGISEGLMSQSSCEGVRTRDIIIFSRSPSSSLPAGEAQ
jgi:hypothetical protein